VQAFEGLSGYTATSLEGWDVGSVTDFSYMFSRSGVTADLSNWDVGSGTYFNAMFSGASDFNSNLCAWGDILGGSSASFTGIFQDTLCPSQYSPNVYTVPPSTLCSVCSPPATASLGRCFQDKTELLAGTTSHSTDSSENTALTYTYGWPINNWCVSQVEDFSSLFANSDFNEPIGDWDTSRARTMNGMFSGNSEFNQPLRWNTTLVTDMQSMFYGATSFNQDLPFDTQNVESLASAFSGATVFNGDLSSWTTSKVVSLQSTFFNAVNFQGGSISNWNVAKVKDIGSAFRGAVAFQADLSSWDVSGVTTMRYGKLALVGFLSAVLCQIITVSQSPLFW